MIYNADFLIQRRREQWDEYHDLEKDNLFRYAVAREITENPKLLKELKKYPEKLIELTFVVVDKEQNTLPFFFNEVQQEFLNILNQAIQDFENNLISEISLLILKGRQQGFTTVVTAYQLSRSLLNKNFQGFTLADKASNAEVIFQNKAKYIYEQLPGVLKPTEKFNNKKQFMFEKINSSWSVDTATKEVGRSRTINFFHGSECAFWKDGISSIQAALGEAFTKNCIKIYESTANGYNDYEIMWSSGNHINCFFEWWKTKEYRISFQDENSKSEFNKKIDSNNGEWVWERLKWLRDIVKLELEQLYWYFKKYEGYIDKELIKQEYPCSPQEAFLQSGANAFDVEKILIRLKSIPKPLKVGYFIYDYDEEKPVGKKISNIKWVNDRKGYIQIYQVPNVPKMTKYCIGGDTAGDGSDYFTAHVLDARTGEQVAVLKRQFGADLYAKQLYCLGLYYGNALIGIESNYDTYPIMELQRYGYYNQYVREYSDTYTQKTEKKFGFKTTTITRPLIISRLIQIVRDDAHLINDRDTLEELQLIIKNEKGRVEAASGKHDDQMMGLAIAYHVREQVVFEKDDILVNPTYQFNLEKAQNNSEKEKIEVV